MAKSMVADKPTMATVATGVPKQNVYTTTVATRSGVDQILVGGTGTVGPKVGSGRTTARCGTAKQQARGRKGVGRISRRD